MKLTYCRLILHYFWKTNKKIVEEVEHINNSEIFLIKHFANIKIALIFAHIN